LKYSNKIIIINNKKSISYYFHFIFFFFCYNLYVKITYYKGNNMDLSHSLGQYIILAFAIAVVIFVTFYDFDKKDHQHNIKK
ncbi:hypothetical protein ACLQZR_001794, partial [Campylobacter jejuni]